MSSDDMEFLNFETNNKSGSPEGRRTGTPFSMVEDGSQSSPTSNTSPQDVGGDKKPVIPLIAIDSFLPLLKYIPALVLDGNTYHLRGAISKSDLQLLSEYVQTIGEFTLNKNSTRDGQHIIAPGTFMRLAQLKIRDAPGPLLPSLKQLRVIEPDESSISQLSLFFTKSLRSLEATGVPEAQQSALLTFLITLVDEAPLLSAITLGPGSFTATCLNACLKFDHLSSLELLDASRSIDFNFLVAIGGLPELETFILNARTATYISPPVAISTQDELWNPFPSSRPPFDYPRPQSPTSKFPTSWDSPRPRSPIPPSKSPTSWDSPRPPKKPTQKPPTPWDSPHSRAPSPTPKSPTRWDSSLHRTQSPTPKSPTTPQPCDSEPIDIQTLDIPDGAASSCFARLRRLEIIGNLSLIRDLYEQVTSANLERLGMTLVRTATPTSYITVPVDRSRTPTRVLQGENEKTLPISNKVKKKRPSASIAEVRIDLETHSVFTLVENAVSEKWRLTLKSVHLGHLQDYRSNNLGMWNGTCYPDPDPIALPFTTLGILLKHEILEDLEIAGWTLAYSAEKKHPIDYVLQAALPNLKVIHLPVGGPTPGIQLDKLLPIIRAFPRLVSLQCGLEQPWPSVPLTPAADIPLHGLKVLSVGHKNSNIDQKQQLGIASFLDNLFPDLERIETHTGHHEEIWAYIYELIKICQVSRLNHAKRLSCGPHLA